MQILYNIHKFQGFNYYAYIFISIISMAGTFWNGIYFSSTIVESCAINDYKIKEIKEKEKEN